MEIDDEADDWGDPPARLFCGRFEFSLEPLKKSAGAMWEMYRSGREVKPAEGIDWTRVHWNLVRAVYGVIHRTVHGTDMPCACVLSGILRMVRVAHCAGALFRDLYLSAVELIIYAIATYVFEAYVEPPGDDVRATMIDSYGDRRDEARLAFNAVLVQLITGTQPEDLHCPVDVSILLGGEASAEKEARQRLTWLSSKMLQNDKEEISLFLGPRQ